MRGTKKGIRQKVGQVLRIPLGDGTYGYCQMVDKVTHAFFDYRDEGEGNVEKILKAPMIFKCTVDSYIINKGYWKILDVRTVREDLKKYERGFSYNPFHNHYQIFEKGQGFVSATYEEIKDMEPFASWTHNGVEQRLRDHFAGRPNYDWEHSRNRENSNFPRKALDFYAPYGCELVEKENWVYAPLGTKVFYDPED